MKLFSLLIVTILLTTSCSSHSWYAVSSRDPATILDIKKTKVDFHLLETSWGEIEIKMGVENKENQIPITIKIINNKDEEISYNRDFFNFVSLSQTHINVVNNFADKTIINEDSQSFWNVIGNKFIPSNPVETKVIAGAATIKKGYFIKDTLFIDARDLAKDEQLSVLVSPEFIKLKEQVALEFAVIR